MSRVASLLACLLLAASFCAAQDAAPSSAPAARTAIPTQLAKSLDVKKLKVGDEVTTKTTVGLHMPNMLIPSGSTVVGHVTSVQSKAKGDPQSSLGITFDKIEISGGKSVPIQPAGRTQHGRSRLRHAGERDGPGSRLDHAGPDRYHRPCWLDQKRVTAAQPERHGRSRYPQSGARQGCRAGKQRERPEAG
jgi:hypothetical protein